jgi:hypothetical protein
MRSSSRKGSTRARMYTRDKLMARDWIDERMLVAKILAAALFLSLAIYAVVGFVIAGQENYKAPLQIWHFSKIIMAGAGLSIGILSLLIRGLLLSEKNLMKPSGIEIPVSDESLDPAHWSIFLRFFSAHVICLALAEAIGVIGLVVLFMTGDSTCFVALLVLSALAMIPHIPRKARLEEVLKNYEMKKQMGMPEHI